MSPRAAGAAARKAARKWSSADRKLLAADSNLAELMRAGGPLDPADRRRGRPDDAYGTLVRAIVGQQLSTKAARTIWGRLAEPYGGGVPTPAEILGAEPESLRAAGLSWSKVDYLRDLAAQVEEGGLDLERLSELADEDVIAALIEIKGIGRWTAEMFLIFYLERPDVISTGDLGIRRAVQLAYGLDELPGPTELERIAEPWRPHRTLASLYLWRSLDAAPELVP